ncbi:hypothetical protein [Paenibacillus sp. FSL K6-0108]|uniref:hypothetical protein n=1 Tax=Paenibacillus sp. FSL K6-0108 TaxID=2921417 RepID=UPI0032514770
MRIKSILIIVTEEMEQQPVREAADAETEAVARIRCLTALLLLPGQLLFLTTMERMEDTHGSVYANDSTIFASEGRSAGRFSFF